jgi:hypothetical protein
MPGVALFAFGQRNAYTKKGERGFRSPLNFCYNLYLAGLVLLTAALKE